MEIRLVQSSLGVSNGPRFVQPFKQPLLKWIGNKQRKAHIIASYFPHEFGNYIEPFLGSGAVLGTLMPDRALATDTFKPLMEIWITLKEDPELLVDWYRTRWERLMGGDKRSEYEAVKAEYNRNPNGADLLFLSRSSYGGVVRFRKADGFMSTPVGAHTPISPRSFADRVRQWRIRVTGASFSTMDYAEAFSYACRGDVVYCDPPYKNSQAILYGAQNFNLEHLLVEIEKAKGRGVFVALSIDGSKKSGAHLVELPIPDGLFEREVFIDLGPSQLKRFQMSGRSMEEEHVKDRLLLTA